MNTAFISEGSVFLLDRPYLPPITFIFLPASLSTLTTSKYNGSADPDSFVLSKTAIFLTVFGNAFKKYFDENGLYNLTIIN